MTAAFIFDLYGTLLNISHDSRPFDQLARRADKYRPAIEFALTSSNPTLADFAANIGLQPQPDVPQLQSQLDDDIHKIHPFRDAITTLKTLKQHGIKTAVISNLATPYKQPFAYHEFDDLVDVKVFSCDCGQMKPSREIYELAAKQLGCDRNDTLMVGDSLRSDVNGPSQIGIMGLHLVRDGRSSSAQTVITSLHSVLTKCNITTG